MTRGEEKKKTELPKGHSRIAFPPSSPVYARNARNAPVAPVGPPGLAIH